MRTLLLSIILLLAACQPYLFTGGPVQDDTEHAQELQTELLVETEPPVAGWLQIAFTTMQLTPAQALEQLAVFPSSREKPVDRFRFGLLNQRLNDRTGWVRARNTMRELGRDQQLDPQLVHLVNIFMQYNQSMINAEARQHLMAQDLEKVREEQRALQEKIEALTSIEQNISTRKELTADGVDASSTSAAESR